VAEDTRSGEAPPPAVSGADIRTFLFVDMRGYTRFTQEHGDEAASALAGRFADFVRATVPENEGERLELRRDEAFCVPLGAAGLAGVRRAPAALPDADG
jgi:class 3 adenylate cyclase